MKSNNEFTYEILLDKNRSVRAISLGFFMVLGIVEGLVAGYFIWQ